MQKENVVQNAAEQGAYIVEQLRNQLADQNVIVRGFGLMIGVEIVDERKPADHMGSLPADGQLAAAIQAACFNNKLLLEKGGRNGTVIRLLCPLIITHDECVEAVSRFKKAIAEALVATRGA